MFPYHPNVAIVCLQCLKAQSKQFYFSLVLYAVLASPFLMSCEAQIFD